MSELNIEKAKNQPKKDEVITLNLDNLEEELNSVFGELDDGSEVQFESQHQEIKPESVENVFLAENPEARNVIEGVSDTEVEFEGINDKNADAIKASVRQKIDKNQILLGLTGEVLAEAEHVKNKIFSGENIATIPEDQIEEVAEKLYKKIEAAVAEVEMKYSSVN